MAAVFLRKIDTTILIISSIYNLENYNKILNFSKEYKNIILNGGLCSPFIQNNKISFLMMKNYLTNHANILYNISGDDMNYAISHPDEELSKWIFHQPNVVYLEFYNQTNTIITNGGITPQMTKESLKENIETSFVSFIEGKPWHNKYYGKYGYIISNNPLTTETPRFYPYSLQMGNKYGFSAYAQEVSPKGLRNTILL